MMKDAAAAVEPLQPVNYSCLAVAAAAAASMQAVNPVRQSASLS